jgi:WbqC-like protein family
MKVAIHQPNFLSRLKVLQKLAYADCWVALDRVQYSQGDWQNRTRLVATNRQKNEFWLTLPVSRPNGRKTLISEAEVIELSKTVEQCRQSIRHAFRSSAHWSAVSDYWNEVEESITSNSLTGVVIPTMAVVLKRFASLPKIVLASELEVGGSKSTLMANICEVVGASEYLADSGALAYLRMDCFLKTKVIWQHWRPPEIAGDSIPWRNVSFINFLARYGAAALRDHLTSGVFSSALPSVGFTSSSKASR